MFTLQYHNFDIRFAQTGCHQKFQRISSMAMLMQTLYKDYKIQIPNQKIISKKGIILSTNSSLDDENIFKNTFVHDPNNTKQMQQTKCVYIFNHRELLRNIANQNNPIDDSIHSKLILNKQHQTCIGLRHKVFEFVPLSQKFDKEKFYNIYQSKPTLVELANQWLNNAEQFFEISTDYKENCYCIDDFVQRTQNQRKGINILGKNLQVCLHEKCSDLQKLKSNIQTFKKGYDDVLSQENQNQIKESSYFNLKKLIYEKYNGMAKKFITLQRHYQMLHNKYKEFKLNISQIHNEMEKKKKQIDNQTRSKQKHFTQMSDEMKEKYVILTESARQFVENCDDSKIIALLAEKKNIETKYNQYKQIGRQYVEESEQLFLQIYRLSRSHEQLVRTQYKKYYEIYLQIEENLKNNYQNTKNELYQMYKLLDELSEVANKGRDKIEDGFKMKALKQLEDREIRRRYNFNMKLLGIQEQLKEIVKEELTNRRNFLEEALGYEETYDHNLLSNVRAPCILLNYDQSSDRELLLTSSGSKNKSMRNSFNLKENFINDINLQIYRSSSGMDRVLQELEFIKNCQTTLKKDDAQNEVKVKNIQLLLEKSADIFHHIYTQKLNILAKQYQAKQQMLINNINSLATQNSFLRGEKIKYEENRNNEAEGKKQLQSKIEKLETQFNGLIAEKAHLQNKLKDSLEDNERKTKEYQNLLEENKKLKQQKRDTQQRISKQVNGTLETLCLELERSVQRIKELEDLNQEYKGVMGDQQVRIVTLQTQLKIYQEENNQSGDIMSNSLRLKESFYGEHLQLNKKSKSDEEIQKRQSNRENETQKTQQQLEQIELLQPKVSKKDTHANQQLKQIQREITKLQKKIQELQQENEDLKNENLNLNQEIFKIAMKDTEDEEIQTQGIMEQEQYGQKLNEKVVQQISQKYENKITTLLNDFIKLQQNPVVGQLRVFLPFNSGVYVAIKTNKIFGQPTTTQYAASTLARNTTLLHQTQINHNDQSAWPYILDLNCLSGKARELLMQCTLIVVLRVTKIIPGNDKFYIQGQIVSAIGFQDEDLGTKDYGPMLKN